MEKISYSQAVINMCDMQLEINKILTKQENGEISKEEAFEEISDLVYDDWYIKQIKEQS